MAGRRVLAWVFMCLGFWAGTVGAQSYPSRPLRIIVPFGPGSGSDIVARRLSVYLQERFKQPVTIDNRAGAQGIIATEALRQAPADGYTLGISTNSTHAAAPMMVRKLHFDPLKDFDHIALIGVGGGVALVSSQSPFKSLAELITWSRAHPGRLLYGHSDTVAQISGALLKARGGLPVEGVPYKSAGNVITDLIGGQIQLAFFNYMTASAQVAGGRVIPIAITESHRSARWPGVPALNERFPGYELNFFIGLSAPRGLPPDVVAALHSAISEAMDDPRIKAPLEETGLTFRRLPPGGYAEFIRGQIDVWRAHFTAAGIEPQ